MATPGNLQLEDSIAQSVSTAAGNFGSSASPGNTDRADALIKSLRQEPEPALDACCQMAAALCQCEMSLVSLVDGTTQWLVASLGLSLKELPQKGSLCDRVVNDPRLHELTDITVTEGYEKTRCLFTFPRCGITRQYPSPLMDR